MFEKYQHVTRFGTSEVGGIEAGTCHIFPKLDGTNGSIWFDERLRCGSRNRELSLAQDNHGFMEAVINDERYKAFFAAAPHLRLFGEWLVPHTIKTYREEAWRKFYVFDVVDESVDNMALLQKGVQHIPFEEYEPWMKQFGIDYIPCVKVIENPSKEQLYACLEDNTYLMQQGELGEGIVIKNYDFATRYGRQTWAKIVRSEFKDKALGAHGPTKQQGACTVEQDIATIYVTEALVRKELAKIENLNDGKPVQPRLLSTVYYCILTEEAWNFVKKFKNPTIDFKLLQRHVTLRVKKFAQEYF